MGIYVAKNYATSTLAGALSAVVTTLTVQTGHGDRFPEITGTDFTYLMLEDSLLNSEIIKVTARAAGSDSMTIVRGQLGTSARSWLSGDLVECRPEASQIQETINHVASTSSAHNASAIGNTPAGNIVATTVQAAINELDSEKLGLTTGGTVSGNVDLTGNVTFDGAAGSVGQVLNSGGTGATPSWGSVPSEMATTGTGTGTLLVTNNSTGALELADLAARLDLVDYRIANPAGTEYEIGSGSITYTNTGGVTWTEVFGDFDGQDIKGTAYGAGVRVIVGGSGKLLTSTDDVNWTLRDGGFGSTTVNAVIYAGGKFVAVGGGGKLSTSSDGITWTLNSSAATAMSSQNINAIAHNGTYYVIGGALGLVATATDATGTWTANASATTANGANTVRALACGGGYTICAGSVASAKCADPPTGTWAAVTEGFAGDTVYGLAYGNVSGTTPTFVAVGTSGKITYSTHATFTTWSSATPNFGSSTVNAVTFAGGYFVAVGDSGKIGYDADGQGSWTAVTPISALSLLCVGYGNSAFVAGGVGAVRIGSSDGVSWSNTGTKAAGNTSYAVAYANSLYVVAGVSGKLATSSDAVTWTERSSGFSTTNINDVIYGGKWVASGDSDTVATSTDGSSWTAYTGALGGGSGIYVSTYGNSVYVVAGAAGKLSTSATALSASWTTRTSGFTSDAIYGLAYALIGATHTFVAVGTTGKIASSVDGSAATWTLRTTPITTNLYSVAYGNGKFVAVGDSGVCLYSTDGTTWYQAATVAVGAAFQYVKFASGLFVAVGMSGVAITSPDGITWTQQTSGTTLANYSVTADSTQFLVVGVYGALYTSPVGASALSLARSTQYITSNSNSLVSFSAGTKNVSMSPRNDLALTTTTTGTGDMTLAQSRGMGALLSNNGNASRVAYRVFDAYQWEAGIGKLTNTSGMVQRSVTVPTGSVTSICHDGTKWTAFTNTQTYYTSYDGLTWTSGSLTYDAGTYTGKKWGATFANGVYVLMDESNYIYTSTNGTSFTRRTAWGSAYTTLLAYGNGVWVGVSLALSTAYYSLDNGATWTASTNSGQEYSNVAFGNGTFVATNYDTNGFHTSSDGVTWTARTAAAYGPGIAFGNGLFVFASVGGNVYTSADGVDWTSRGSCGVGSCYSITYGDGVFLIAGDSTSVAYSSDGITWATSTGLEGSGSSFPARYAYGNGRFVGPKQSVTGVLLTAMRKATTFTLIRGPQESSNSNLAVDFTAGTKYVQLLPYVAPDIPAADQKGKQTTWVPAGAMVARTTNGAAAGTVETTTNKVMISTLDFDTTTQEFAQFSISMPKGAIEGPISAQVVWSHASTTTNFGVAWEISAVAFSNDDALDAAFSTAVPVTDTGGTTNDLYVTSETLVPVAGTWAAEDTIVFQIARAPSNSADTMAIDARLHGVRLYYYTDANNDA